ncbi:MAG: hypothetical protein MUC97_08445 [Bernardetiaceae bacterium]|jgi:hypothetical protein|nr:hypothetical protein [Bernardetiaceae bacterium]
MKHILFLISLFCFVGLRPAHAQEAQEGTLTGKLVRKPWTKTTQSYCAQGSDYYVLQLASGEELVLEGGRPKRLRTLTDRQVTVVGRQTSKVVKPKEENPMEQRPVGLPGQPNEFTCTVFVVRQLRPARN